ncbi:MAG TPA: hypothetical protein VEJ63_15565 [Planctomycetota bacterium]|nr:hypothetical protein [Planctomycetota bacterium]
MNRTFLIGSCLAAFLAFAARSADTPQQSSQSTAPPYFLIVDYIPPASYAGDPIACCFRIENATATEAEMELSVSVQDASGKELKAKTDNIKVPAKSDRPLQMDLESETGAKFVFSLKCKGAAEVHATTVARLIREDDAWPATTVRNGRLESGEAREIIVPVIRKRLKARDRTYAPLKWIMDPAPGESALAAGKGIAFVPGGWGIAKSERQVPLGPYEPNGAAPILRATADVLSSIGAKDQKIPERLVIALPPEDLEVDTDPRVYKLVLETMLAHLRKLGVREIVLLPPIHYSGNQKQRDIYWRAVHEAALVYECQSVDATEYMREEWWRVDTSGGAVYGKKPNKQGLKKFEQALSNLLP